MAILQNESADFITKKQKVLNDLKNISIEAEKRDKNTVIFENFGVRWGLQDRKLKSMGNERILISFLKFAI